MIPPVLIRVRIAAENGRGFSLWLPFFLLWPFAAVLFVLILPFLVIAEIVLPLTGVDFHPLLAILALVSVMSAMRGLKVDVKSPRSRQVVQVFVD
jgi:hypothetical protein